VHTSEPTILRKLSLGAGPRALLGLGTLHIAKWEFQAERPTESDADTAGFALGDGPSLSHSFANFGSPADVARALPTAGTRRCSTGFVDGSAETSVRNL
jgi:hypothetical protein